MTSRLLVRCLTVSMDGFGAGPDQSLDNPLGVRGPEMMEWLLKTRSFHHMLGQDGGETGVDNAMAEEGFRNVGANIMGRNMFGPVRGPWPDEEWKGWWGEDPPYHTPTYVLTHYVRAPVHMKGGTTFIFATEGIEATLEQARAAAKDAMCAWAAVSRRCASISRPASSTSCTSRCGPSCSETARSFSMASTCVR
jgi:dihydrofolate reductase